MRTDPANDRIWARRGGSDTSRDTLATAMINGPTIVTTKSSDTGFRSEGCGEWTNDLSAISSEDSGQDRDSADAPF